MNRVLHYHDIENKEQALDYLFDIEADRFKRFRRFLSGRVSQMNLTEQEAEDLEGMMNWLDTAADIAKDLYGHDVLFSSDEAEDLDPKQHEHVYQADRDNCRALQEQKDLNDYELVKDSCWIEIGTLQLHIRKVPAGVEIEASEVGHCEDPIMSVTVCDPVR